jgi:malonyl-CoA O-methyltransferase
MTQFEANKAQVALRFAQAGQSYAQHAVVQKQIAQQLLLLIQQYAPEILNQPIDRVFEIGCGSGNLSQLLMQNLDIQHFFINDLYAEVQQHFRDHTSLHWRIGDIERLEFPQGLDLVASSSALQWIHDLDAVLQQVKHSLNEQGLFCFSSFGSQNLKEIKALTGQGLSYLSIAALQDKLQQAGFEILHLSEQTTSLYFQHPKQVLQHLKATGVTATASQFRWTKQSLADFYQAYQQFSHLDQSGQIQYSLSYHPIYCIARRMP